MKKILTVILIFSILLTSFGTGAWAKSEFSELKGIGIVPDSFSEETKDEYVKREEFAYVATRLIDFSGKEPAATKFTDVSEKSEYSGYIRFLSDAGYINGVSEDAFSPEGNVTADMAYKIFVNILGYGSFAQIYGGYPEGYSRVAGMLGITVSTKDGFVTQDGLATAAEYVLTTAFDSMEYAEENGKLNVYTVPNAKFSLLGDRLKISVYSAYINSVNEKKNSAELIINGNKYDTNNMLLNKNQTVTYAGADGINLADYECIPASVWVDNDEHIVYVKPNRNVSVMYGYIDSVNGDMSSDSKYSISAIKRITLLDDEEEYDVGSGAVMKANGKRQTAPQRLCGNFARLVTINDEITFIETWDLKEGGLITSVSKDSLTYTKGIDNGLVLKDFDKFSAIRVFIDNEPSSLNQIRTDSVFDYYADDDILTLAVSEKLTVDKFVSVNTSGKTLQIGNITYRSDKLYYSTDKVTYKSGSGIFDIVNMIVNAYTAPDGFVRYIRPADDETAAVSKFYGAVVGVEVESAFTDDPVPLEDETTIRICKFGDEITYEDYELTKNTVFTGTDIDTVTRNAKSYTGSGVYEFAVSKTGKIKEISTIKPYPGFGSPAQTSVSSFIDAMYAQTTFANKLFYFDNAYMVGIYKDENGEFCAQRITWSDIRSQSYTNAVTMTAYSDESYSTTPSLVVLAAEDFTPAGGQRSLYGLVTSYGDIAVDINGDTYKTVTVLSGKTVNEYKVSDSFIDTYFLSGKTPVKNAVIHYKDGLNGENQISISEIYDLSDDYDAWSYETNDAAAGLHRGTVKKIDSARLLLEENEASYFIDKINKDVIYMELNEGNDAEKRFSGITSADIYPGDEIFYCTYAGGYGLKLVFVVKVG